MPRCKAMMARPKVGIEPFYKDLGDLIRKAREKKGMSQAELGRDMRFLTRGSIGNIEAGRQRVYGHQLSLFCEILDITLDEVAALYDKKIPAKKPDRDLLQELQEKLGEETGRKIFDML